MRWAAEGTATMLEVFSVRPGAGSVRVDIHADPAPDISQPERAKRIILLESALEGWLPKSPWGTRIRLGFERQLEKLRNG